MTQKFTVRTFDSRTTGYLVSQDVTIKTARAIAIGLSNVGAKKAQIEGIQGFSETYENGVKTEWSA